MIEIELYKLFNKWLYIVKLINSGFDFLKFTYDFLMKILAKLGEYCYDIVV